MRDGLHLKVFVVLFTMGAVLVLASTSWAQPGVYVTDIYTPTSLIAPQDTTVTAELTNYGDAGYFYLYIYRRFMGRNMAALYGCK